MMRTRRRNDRGEGLVGTMVAMLTLSIITLGLVQAQMRLLESDIDRDVRKRLGEVVVQVLEPATYLNCSNPLVDCGPGQWTGFVQTPPDSGIWVNGQGAELEAITTPDVWSLRLDAHRYTWTISNGTSAPPDCLMSPPCLGWLLPGMTHAGAFEFPMRAVTIADDTIADDTDVIVAAQQVRSILVP